MRVGKPGECENSADMQILPGKVEQLTTEKSDLEDWSRIILPATPAPAGEEEGTP